MEIHARSHTAGSDVSRMNGLGLAGVLAHGSSSRGEGRASRLPQKGRSGVYTMYYADYASKVTHKLCMVYYITIRNLYTDYMLPCLAGTIRIIHRSDPSGAA